MRTILISLTAALLVLLFAPRAQAIEDLTVHDVIDWAQSGVGFSYWWGKGKWNGTSKSSPGSCSGSCPRCTHTGSYGADCSGFIAKVWRVPSATARETNGHPYNTGTFYHSATYWKRVDRGSAKRADALVYSIRKGKKRHGHIFLYDSKDPWGVMWAYECKGCRAGCVLNLRTATSNYRAIRRNSLIEGPHTCTDHKECSTGLCAWNGENYCCRSKGFTGEDCTNDKNCTSGQVCAYNGTKFVCTKPVACESDSGSGTGGGTTPGGGGGGTGCGGSMQAEPWRYSSIGPSFLLIGLLGAWRRRHRNAEGSKPRHP